jgi:hypothetical protein
MTARPSPTRRADIAAKLMWENRVGWLRPFHAEHNQPLMMRALGYGDPSRIAKPRDKTSRSRAK